MERGLRIYIVEDDVSMIDTLRDFIEDQGLGEVVGSSEEDGSDEQQIAARNLCDAFGARVAAQSASCCLR